MSDMKFPKLSPGRMIERLTHPRRKLRAVLDTDTYNETDDQFALAYMALCPEKVQLEAIYAAPFHNELSDGPADGMQKSYEEIGRLLARLKRSPDGLVFRGSEAWIKDQAAQGPVESEAARDLVRKAMDSPDDDPLYVLAIGAPTNVSSALLMEPRIVEKIVLVWLGGQPLSHHSAREFNLQQDIKASQVLYDSGVPFIQIPCAGVASHLTATTPELEHYMGGKSPIADYLIEVFNEWMSRHPGWIAKEIWDISGVGWLLDPDWVSTDIVHAPVLTDQYTYSFDNRRHFMAMATWLKRNAIYGDMYKRLGQGA